MNPAALFAPVFLVFELWQLVVSERYMGIKQIRVNADPRELPMTDWMAATWAGGLVTYYVWMFTLLLHPVGRAQGMVLIVMTGPPCTAVMAWLIFGEVLTPSMGLGMALTVVGVAMVVRSPSR